MTARKYSLQQLQDQVILAKGSERARIVKAQAGAIRNLRVLYAPDCDGAEGYGCTERRHRAECARWDFERQLRWLRDATREPKR